MVAGGRRPADRDGPVRFRFVPAVDARRFHRGGPAVRAAQRPKAHAHRHRGVGRIAGGRDARRHDTRRARTARGRLLPRVPAVGLDRIRLAGRAAGRARQPLPCNRQRDQRTVGPARHHRDDRQHARRGPGDALDRAARRRADERGQLLDPARRRETGRLFRAGLQGSSRDRHAGGRPEQVPRGPSCARDTRAGGGQGYRVEPAGRIGTWCAGGKGLPRTAGRAADLRQGSPRRTVPAVTTRESVQHRRDSLLQAGCRSIGQRAEECVVVPRRRCRIPEPPNHQREAAARARRHAGHDRGHRQQGTGHGVQPRRRTADRLERGDGERTSATRDLRLGLRPCSGRRRRTDRLP